jgi:hypothetical protein
MFLSEAAKISKFLCWYAVLKYIYLHLNLYFDFIQPQNLQVRLGSVIG